MGWHEQGNFLYLSLSLSLSHAISLSFSLSFSDWMGWHEQGDGKLFLGVNIQQGRIKNADGVNVKSALIKIVNELNLTMILSPSQSVVFKVRISRTIYYLSSSYYF
jgi:hypothetical protein